MSKNKKPAQYDHRDKSSKEPETVPAIRIDDICGVWRSYSIFPTLLIYRDRTKYKLCVMQTDDLGQVQPEIFTLEVEDGNEYTLLFTMRNISVKFNLLNDTISHGEFGNYYRNSNH